MPHLQLINHPIKFLNIFKTSSQSACVYYNKKAKFLESKSNKIINVILY